MKDDDNKKLNIVTRRVFFLILGKFSIVLTIISRMFYLQFFKSKEYKSLSDNNRTKISLMVPERGEIYDRFQKALAINKQVFRLYLNREEISISPKEILSKLCELLNYNKVQHNLLLKKLKNTQAKRNVLLIDNLPWEDLLKIEFNIEDLPGIFIEKGYLRNYPFSEIFSHLTGYIGAASELQMISNPLISHPEIKIGKNGLEKTYNDLLSGKAGIKKTEVNAQRRIVKELSIEREITGENLNTSLDADLQNYIYNMLGPNAGSVIVMDIETGGILSMVSNPGYDPNKFSNGISEEEWSKLIRDPALPLTNKAISLVYPPGSIFKLVTALAGLNAGIDPNFTIFCPGYFDIGDRKLKCANKKGHGKVNFYSGIMYSCNPYFATIAKIMGIDHISNTALKLGLGKKMLLELPREHPGLVPSRAWKQDHLAKDWLLGDTINCCIGQGYTLTTPLQLCVLVGRLASGRRINPYLVKSNLSQSTLLDFNPKHLEAVRKGMFMCVNTQGGTSYNNRIIEEEYLMAGKTSTAQVIAKRKPDEDLNLISQKKFRNHGTFVGFAPYNNPRFVCSVMLENSGGAGKTLPIARDILLYVQKKYAKIK